MENLENRLVARYFPLSYYLAMSGISFRDRVLAAMKSQSVNKADLSRRSQVPYHTLDKFLKRDNATTSAENAKAIADALGIKMDGEVEFDELRQLFFALPEEKRGFVIDQLRGLVSLEGD